MDTFARSKEYIGQYVHIRTKSGMNHQGTIDSVEMDGEIVLRENPAADRDKSHYVFVNAGCVESLSGPKVKK